MCQNSARVHFSNKSQTVSGLHSEASGPQIHLVKVKIYRESSEVSNLLSGKASWVTFSEFNIVFNFDIKCSVCF